MSNFLVDNWFYNNGFYRITDNIDLHKFYCYYEFPSMAGAKPLGYSAKLDIDLVDSVESRISD